MMEETSNPDRSGGAKSVPFEQIVSLCADFTTEWQRSRRPDIPSYLDRVGDDAKETLLRNLLEQELRRRRRDVLADRFGLFHVFRTHPKSV